MQMGRNQVPAQVLLLKAKSATYILHIGNINQDIRVDAADQFQHLSAFAPFDVNQQNAFPLVPSFPFQVGDSGSIVPEPLCYQNSI